MRAFLAILGLALVTLPARADELRLFTLGSGDVAGSYYAAASAICDIVNRSGDGTIRCSPDPTAGSIYNLDALRSGELDFALVQSDFQREALQGTGAYATKGPMPDLQSVMALYNETLTLLVRPDSGIAGFADLRNKRVDVGPPASGRRGTVDRVLGILGYEAVDFTSVSELPSGVAVDALCAGTIDATLLVVGHPNAVVARGIEQCDARIIPMTPAERAAVIKARPEMLPSVLRAQTYKGLETDVPGVAVTATVVARKDIDPALSAALVRDTILNLPLLARRAPVLARLDPTHMRRDGLTAPLDPGAKAAFDAVLGPVQ